MLNYIDLFAGAGGLSEGFSATGYNPIAHVEMNEDACNSLRTRACYYYLKQHRKLFIYRQYLHKCITREELYSSVPQEILNTVINVTMAKNTMPELFKRIDVLMESRKIASVDLIIGGPPCQAYSLVGRCRCEKSKDDPRNTLYKLYLQVLRRYKPKMFVFENVPGLYSAGEGKYYNDIKREFIKAGYKMDSRELNACDFGVLQIRKRIVIIGWRDDFSGYYPNFEKVSIGNYTVADILSDLPAIHPGEECCVYAKDQYSKYLRKSNIRKPRDILTWHVARSNIDRDREIYRNAISMWKKNHKRIKYTDLPEKLCTHKNRKSFLDRFKVVADDITTSHTIMAHISKDGHYFIHPDIEQARSISVREAARIQSFPDDFLFEGSRTSAFVQIGNAVPPLMAKGIAKSLMKQLED